MAPERQAPLFGYSQVVHIETHRGRCHSHDRHLSASLQPLYKVEDDGLKHRVKIKPLLIAVSEQLLMSYNIPPKSEVSNL